MNLKPGIKLLEETVGDGLEASKGDLVKVRLNGWLNQGKHFQIDHIDSFELGARRIIPGIEYSIEGMKVNGTRKIKISPHLGYKDVGVQGIVPPDALLIYEIVLLRID